MNTSQDQLSDGPLAAEPELLTAKEVAKLLRLGPRTIRQWAEFGVLPAIKLRKEWRFEKAAILLWLTKRKDETGRD